MGACCCKSDVATNAQTSGKQSPPKGVTTATAVELSRNGKSSRELRSPSSISEGPVVKDGVFNRFTGLFTQGLDILSGDGVTNEEWINRDHSVGTIIRAVHPHHLEPLQAEIVPWPDNRPRDHNDNRKVVMVRWKRYWLDNEPDALSELDDSDFRVSHLPKPVNKEISWLQTVGSPSHTFAQGESALVRDTDSGLWHQAHVQAVEKFYYVLRLDNGSKELIRKNSSRLQKKRVVVASWQADESRPPDLWSTFEVGRWIRVKRTRTGHEPFVHGEIFKRDAKNFWVKIADTNTRIHELERTERKPLTPDANIGIGINDIAVDTRPMARESTEVVIGRDDGSLLQVEHFDNPARRWETDRQQKYALGVLKLRLKLTLKSMNKEGGHSLFRAFSHQLFGTPDNHMFLRRKCVAYITQHFDYFQQFVDINFELYMNLKRKGIEEAAEYFCLGDHLDIQAICEMYDCSCEIYSELTPDSEVPSVTFYTGVKTVGTERLPCLRLSYAGNECYDSLFREDLPFPIQLVDAASPGSAYVNRSQLVLNARRRAQAVSARALQRTMAKLTGEKRQANVVQYVGPVNLKRESGNELVQFRELLKAAGIEWTDFTGYSIDQSVTADFTPGRNTSKNTTGAIDDDGVIIDSSGALPGSKAAREAAAARAAEQAAKRAEITIMYPYIPPTPAVPGTRSTDVTSSNTGSKSSNKKEKKKKDKSSASSGVTFAWQTPAADTFGAPWLTGATSTDENECVWVTPGSPVGVPSTERAARNLYHGRGPLMLIQGAQHRVEAVVEWIRAFAISSNLRQTFGGSRFHGDDQAVLAVRS